MSASFNMAAADFYGEPHQRSAFPNSQRRTKHSKLYFWMLLAVKHGEENCENRCASPEKPITDVMLVAQSPFLFDNPEDALFEFAMFPKPKEIMGPGKIGYFLRVRIAQVDYESFPASISAEFIVDNQAEDAAEAGKPKMQPLLVFADWMIENNRTEQEEMHIDDRAESGLSEATTIPVEEAKLQIETPAVSPVPLNNTEA